MIVDFRKSRANHSPISINGATVARVKSTNSLGVHIIDYISWATYTSSLAKRAQQHLYFLWCLKKNKIASPSIHPHNLLQGHHREHPDHLHLCFVWELPHFQPQSCTKGRADSGVDYQHLNPLPTRYVHPPSARYVHPPVCLLGHQLVIDSHPSHGLFTTLPSGMLRPPLSGPMWHNTLWLKSTTDNTLNNQIHGIY